MTDDRDRELVVGPRTHPDKYRLVRLEARGGEASLWRAEVELAGAPELVAVKILHAEHHEDLPHLTRRWAEQAELLRFVTHPGVVGVREHFEGDPPHHRAERPRRRWRAAPPGALYLVMNWVSGRPLRDWLLLHPGREGTLDALRLLDDLADTLEMLHDGRATPSGRAVVHGDLSPANVVVDRRDGRPVLVDFGLARTDDHVTRSPAGTPGYTAPEVWSHGHYTPAADRYSFAALGFFVLLGTPPPPEPEAAAAALGSHPFLAGAPPALMERLLAGLGADPTRRPTPGAWLAALRGAASTAARTSVPGNGTGTGTGTGTGATGPVEAARRPSTGRTRPADPPAADPPDPPDPPDEVEARLAGCWDGPGALVRYALAVGDWRVARHWWTGRGAGRVLHVKLEDPHGAGWVVVELLLRSDGRTDLVWASGAGGAMTECTTELARWLVSP